MQFNSIVFILFGIIFFALWPILKRRNNTRWVYLVIASFIFYGWWDWRFLFLIIFSGLIDFFAGLGMAKFRKKKTLMLILSLLGNLGTLGLFKYLDFGIGNVKSRKFSDAIKKELDKCIMLCANCHREHHGGILDIAGIV